MRMILASLIGAFLMLLVFGVAFDARFNLTPSMPKGVYRLKDAAPSRGDYVLYRLEGDFGRFVAEREYLNSSGRVEDLPPLLKRLAAVPGDMLHVARSGICIHYGNITHCPAASGCRAVDSQNRPMPPSLLAEGRYPVPDGMGLILGSHEGSLDSRYFGLVELARLHTAEPLFIFKEDASRQREVEHVQ